MIGVDTNVVLRYVLEDDARQSATATRFLDEEARLSDPILINAVMLVELVWTLGRKEGFKKTDILDVLDELAGSRRVEFVQDEVVREAIEAWRSGRADFPDYLIARLNLAAGARTTVTFDQVAALEPGFSPMP